MACAGSDAAIPASDISAVGRRSCPHHFIKGSIEITDIVEPAEGGNLSYFFVRLREQFTAFYNAEAIEVCKGSVTGAVFKAVTKITFAEAGFF